MTLPTDELDVPDHIADEVVDLAVAKATRTPIANLPELSDRLEQQAKVRVSRSADMKSSMPSIRRNTRSYDRLSGSRRTGSRPANPDVFHTE